MDRLRGMLWWVKGSKLVVFTESLKILSAHLFDLLCFPKIKNWLIQTLDMKYDSSFDCEEKYYPITCFTVILTIFCGR